ALLSVHAPHVPRGHHMAQVGHLFEYLDDFLMVGAAGGDDCARMAETFCMVNAELGFQFKPSKTEWLVTVLKYSGLVVDTVAGEVRLDDDRVAMLTASCATSCRARPAPSTICRCSAATWRSRPRLSCLGA